MHGEIETFALGIEIDAQAKNDIDDFEQKQRHDCVVDDSDSDAVKLHDDLVRVAVN